MRLPVATLLLGALSIFASAEPVLVSSPDLYVVCSFQFDPILISKTATSPSQLDDNG